MSDSTGSKKSGGKDSGGHNSSADLLHLGNGNPHAGDEGGEGNWLVSYADMMTLLVGFFVILLSFSSVDQEKFDEARRAITAEFGGTYTVPYQELGERIKEAIRKLGIGDQLLLKVSDAGVEIAFRGTVLFESGSADLKEEASPILQHLIEAVKSDNETLDVTVEGHTDDVPINHGKTFRNNWELSSLRACRVLEAFVDAGLPTPNLTAVGYGSARPTVPNRDANGEAISENQSQNRRVIIRIVRHAEPIMIKLDKNGDSAHNEKKNETPGTPDSSATASAPANGSTASSAADESVTQTAKAAAAKAQTDQPTKAPASVLTQPDPTETLPAEAPKGAELDVPQAPNAKSSAG